MPSLPLRRLATLAAVLLTTLTSPAQTGLRTLTGTVTDRGKEPLKGAVVQIQDEASNAVLSFITRADGTFSFKRLRTDDDYYVWATYRNIRSKRKELSHFTSGKQPSIALVVKLD